MKKNTPPARRLACPFLALALILGACGGDSGSATTPSRTPAPSPTPAPAPAPTPAPTPTPDPALTDEDPVQLLAWVEAALAFSLVAIAFEALGGELEPGALSPVECGSGVIEVSVESARIIEVSEEESEITELVMRLIPKDCNFSPLFPGPFTVSGDPDIRVAGRTPGVLEVVGNVAWTHSDGRSGRCALDLEYTSTVSETSDTDEIDFEGTICERAVSITP